MHILNSCPDASWITLHSISDEWSRGLAVTRHPLLEAIACILMAQLPDCADLACLHGAGMWVPIGTRAGRSLDTAVA